MSNKIVVIGTGTMGSGIATVFSIKEFNVTIFDSSKERLKIGLQSIKSNLDRLAKKGVIEENSADLFLNKIKIIDTLVSIEKDVDLIIEAIYEDMNVKSHLFNELNKIVGSNCIFASNTSSISITELGAKYRPDKFIGMHFMNPVPIMKLVEIIRGYSTSEETFNYIFNLAKQLDKIPVLVNDFPGFISNRILMPMINEAVFALMEGVASKDDIDTVMKLGMNHPMGPLTLADFIGLDVCLAIMNVLYDGFKDSKYRPCPLLVKMVAANKLGRKTGEGFFTY
jgi:3-hydroxybutyryl-CoA dehydrogenase